MCKNLSSPGHGADAPPPRIELPPHLRKPRLRRFEVSEYLQLVYGIQIAPATLAKWSCYNEGPKREYLNRTPLYPIVDLDAWLQKSNPDAE
jgi:hypothetical protein